MTNLKFKKRLCLLTLFVFVLVATLGAWIGINAPIVSTEIADAAVGEYYTGTYYNGLDESLTGDAFQEDLAELITNTHKTITTYGGLMDVWEYSDTNSSGQLIQFYTGYTVSIPSNYNSGTNREHVWPQSLGGFGTSRAGADAHHLRPANTNLNSARGNKFFGEVQMSQSNLVSSSSGSNPCYATSDYFYPGKGYRGATARILMYTQTRWADEDNLKFVISGGSGHVIGNIEDLMKWHIEEPPTAEEIKRNEEVYKVQGNRNPFIDHPEYAEMIYCHDGESYNDELQAVVGQYGSYLDSSIEVESISISPSTSTVATGETTRLSVLAKPAGASNYVTWTSSNPNVASVNNAGEVTGIAAGTATITATSTKSPSITATATISVKAMSAVSITGTPTKTTYFAGDKFNPAGLTVTATYSDGSTKTISNGDCQWLDGTKRTTTLAEGSTTVIMKYGNFEKTVSGITVNKATTQKITFTFGDNGPAGHVDGNPLSSSKSYQEGDYTLALTGVTSIYGSAFDASGNSVLKVGTSSKVGKFAFTVPSEVTSVEFYIAKYKTYESKVTINGTNYTLTKNSNDGQYDVITIDTTTNKTVNFTTVSGSYRCMIDKIVYVKNLSEDTTCTHTPGSWIVDDEASCEENGSQHKECTKCGETLDSETIPATGHKYGDWTPGTNNTETRTCSVCGDVESREAQGGGNTGNEVDQQKVDAFTSAVDAVENANTLTEKWNSIKSALTLYNQLNSAEKTAVAEDYATLEVEIVEYNNGAAVVNAESKKATEDAIMLFAGAFSILAFAAYFLLRR